MADAIALSDDLLRTMRAAARAAMELREQLISPRAIFLALLDDPTVGPALLRVVEREKVRSATASEETAARSGDTLLFKTPDGRTSVWLSREAHEIFLEGARCAAQSYDPKQLVLGFAARAGVAPSFLAAVDVAPGALLDAVNKLSS